MNNITIKSYVIMSYCFYFYSETTTPLYRHFVLNPPEEMNNRLLFFALALGLGIPVFISVAFCLVIRCHKSIKTHTTKMSVDESQTSKPVPVSSIYG